MAVPERSRRAVPAAVLIAGLLVTILVATFAHRSGRAQEALAFDNVANGVQQAVEGRLEAYIAMLRSGAGLFAASEDVSIEEFRAFVSRLELSTRYPGIQGIGFSQYVQPDERAGVAARIRETSHPEFRFWPGEDPTVPVHAIIYLEPLDVRNRLALGFDMTSENVRRAAMDRARDTGMPAATGRVTLVQEQAEVGREQFGFLIYMPVYRPDPLPDTPEERGASLFGFVYSPFRVDDLLHGIVGDRLDGGVHLEVYDGPRQGNRILHRSAASAPDSRLDVTRTLDVAGRQWTLVIRPAVPPGLTLIDLFVLLFVCGGALLSALLFRITSDEIRGREAAEQTARELRASEEALRAANRAKDDFLAVVSHELRTPLNAILGWSQMLKQGQVPSDRRDSALDTIHRNAEVQVKLVGDLLDMSQAVSGHLRLEPQDIDPIAVLSPVVESLRPMASAAGITLEWVPAARPGLIRADPSRLEQILRNLLTNAIKFTPRGGSVHVSAEWSGPDLLVHVRDTGIGIPADMLQVVFEPFRQGDASTTRAHGGVGLGLSIARHLAQLHGGSITVDSDGPGHGAAFTVRLPAQAAAGRADAATASAVHQTAT